MNKKIISLVLISLFFLSSCAIGNKLDLELKKSNSGIIDILEVPAEEIVQTGTIFVDTGSISSLSQIEENFLPEEIKEIIEN